MAKVLLIEDIEDSAKLAKKFLTSYGHDVDVAASGSDALDFASQGGYGVVLLDLGLPDIDGQTLLGRLRNEGKMSDTPIVLCSAWPEEAARKMVDAYGFNGYISKPYKVNNFMEVINAVAS